MPPPAPEDHLRFLTNLQRLLDEGAFVATYKFALLMALADLSVELGDDSGAPLLLSTRDIARKFVEYYWRQALPFPGPEGNTGVLKQNTGKQAAIVERIASLRGKTGGSISRAVADQAAWGGLIGEVDQVVRVMPLWKLQTVGRSELVFLYPNRREGNTIELFPGVAASFRRFHELIRSVVQGAWVRQVRAIPANNALLGQTTDVGEFLFGSERGALGLYQPILRDVQKGECFYCRGKIGGGGDVDHFVPWSRYPVDLGHNFVLAHPTCNRRKRDFLAAERHLERWGERNEQQGRVLAAAFAAAGLHHHLETSKKVTWWAYEQAAAAGASLWIEQEKFEPFPPDFPERFQVYFAWKPA